MRTKSSYVTPTCVQGFEQFLFLCCYCRPTAAVQCLWMRLKVRNFVLNRQLCDIHVLRKRLLSNMRGFYLTYEMCQFTLYAVNKYICKTTSHFHTCPWHKMLFFLFVHFADYMRTFIFIRLTYRVGLPQGDLGVNWVTLYIYRFLQCRNVTQKLLKNTVAI